MVLHLTLLSTMETLVGGEPREHETRHRGQLHRQAPLNAVLLLGPGRNWQWRDHRLLLFSGSQRERTLHMPLSVVRDEGKETGRAPMPLTKRGEAKEGGRKTSLLATQSEKVQG